MDLKEVIESVNEKAMEANNAFHAGHQIVAQRYLQESCELIGKFFDEKGMSATDVTESATSEKPAEDQKDTPAKVPGAAIPATQFDPAAAAQQIGTGSAEPKPPQ